MAAPAPVALILSLGGPPPPRLPDMPLAVRDIEGVAIPMLGFDPGPIAPALRAEWALQLHGLVFEPTSLCAGKTPDIEA